MNFLMLTADEVGRLQWYDHVGTWLAVFLTFAVLSFLYKDNPLYKLAEHVFVGVAAGYTIAYAFWEVFYPNLWKPLFEGDIQHPGPDDWYFGGAVIWRWLLIVPLVLGCFFFARFNKNLSWLSRWSIAFLVGLYAGVNATGYFQGDLILQAKATFVVLDPGQFAHIPKSWDGWMPVLTENLVILVGVLASLTYFFFSKPHRGFIGGTARLGIFFLMVAFGASFGYTVMARVSLFIGRVNFVFLEAVKPYWNYLF